MQSVARNPQPAARNLATLVAGTVVNDTATEMPTVSPTSPRRTVLSFPGSSETLDTPTASRAEEQLLLSPSDSPLKTPKQESLSRRNSESLDSEDLSESAGFLHVPHLDYQGNSKSAPVVPLLCTAIKTAKLNIGQFTVCSVEG